MNEISRLLLNPPTKLMPAQEWLDAVLGPGKGFFLSARSLRWDDGYRHGIVGEIPESEDFDVVFVGQEFVGPKALIAELGAVQTRAYEKAEKEIRDFLEQHAVIKE